MLNRSKLASGALLLAGLLWAAPPPGWILAGGNPRNYETGLDAAAPFGGQPSAYLKSTGTSPEAKQNFGTLMQMFGVSRQYADQRVRLSAWVRSDKIADWAGLWMRVDRKDKPLLSFDNMQNRGIKGTTEWKRYEVVLDVQEDATAIAFGILLTRSGAVWISGVNFEVVGTDVPVTSMVGQPPPQPPAPPAGPQNLNFEK
jgi:hypothetical protein